MFFFIPRKANVGSIHGGFRELTPCCFLIGWYTDDINAFFSVLSYVAFFHVGKHKLSLNGETFAFFRAALSVKINS